MKFELVRSQWYSGYAGTYINYFFVKDYLRNKMITAQNVFSEAQVKNFFIS